LEGEGTRFVGECAVPVPLNAMDVGMSPCAYSRVLGEYVYGDAVFLAN
jgi:hypothetical protein